ncbi:non-ribosomal peptide synthetase [Scytonema hofmannii PCC 7110]|uniref:Non-ribosomal peptide synthetase n=1 Tax=Scytonema hofmannii PCC 7110 TaxID=128403 RepID=A0A139X6N2_9CYAN|nr:non-ribosomal peptide synthetase [Scytonema hofmannii]KYC40344.1 non-ribosomal peptide synthetase [Scytonema hofmannii PCC 7110]
MIPINQNLSLQSNIQSEKQLNYWKQQLADASLVLELPTDKPRPPVQKHEVAKQSFILPQSLWQALHALSQQEGVTVFSTLLAAFQTLLYRYSRQEDILVGYPVMADDRQRTETKANTLVLRTRMSGNPSFQDLLQKVRLVVLEARANQDLPFEKLVEDLQIERSLSYHPLFQVMFVLQKTPKKISQSPTSIDLNKVIYNLDLTLSMEGTEQGLQGAWEYNIDLFNAETIARMSGHFQTLLEQIVANPQQHIDELPLLTATERQKLLVEWNNTQADYPQHCVHEFFEVQASKTPDAVAVVFEDQQLTYRELNNRANQLAHYLRTLGVRPDVLVGICVERSLEMVIGLLGILKAGGAYVPLDPEYPKDRLTFILEDTKTPVMLTQEKLVNSLPVLEAQIVCLDSDWQAIAQHSQENPVSGVAVDDLVYVIYTSGSTGKPKGVMIPHRGICNALYWRQATFKLTEQDKILQTISLSFDPSVWQIFWPLSFGGQLIVARPGGHKDTAYLVKEVVKQQITVLGLVPSIIQALLEEKGFKNCQSLRHATTGGEALSVELMERFFACLNLDNVLVNCYGPTEASIDVTTWICQRVNDSTIAPIGRPITNVQVYILDDNLQPVPVGHSGELYIGGSGLARGYLNRPKLTEEKFIPNPFTSEAGARLYKTGDLARYLPDGNIEFLGRIDHQVKIRGFRIELGEIEATLGTHPALQQTLVMVREDVPGDKGLVAYFVAQPEQVPPSPRELRGFLQDKLPDYMVPAAFVMLDAMPLNPNGKVDRRALPVPDASHFIAANNFVAPRTPTEEVLAAIWMQVLGLERVGIHDNFFELGGHSLLATQVISRLRQTFGAEISVQRLFETPTIAGLASAISTFENQSPNQHLTIPRRTNRDSAPLSYVQQQLWFLAQLKPDSAAYNIVEAIQLQGDLKVDVLQKSLDAIVVHHEALRTNFIAEDGNPVQVIGEPRSVELKVIDLKDCPLSARASVVKQQLQDEAHRPFNLASDLMLRGCLFELSPQEHVLLLVMHHIATDGWSMSILFEQLTSLYKAFTNNLPNPLPELPIQFADYVVWQHQWLEGEVLEKQLNYWKQHLANATTVLELPTDRQRQPVQSFRGATQSFEIPQSLSQALNALSRQEGVTLFMTLLAAFQILLYRYTGQQDILVGSPIAGRNRTEVENLIGFFVNTLVLRTDLSGNPSYLELLQRVRAMAISAYVNQDVSFEKLVEELQPERSLSYNPFFQVLFVLQNAPKQTLELSGLSITPLNVDKLTSQFDLSLTVEQTEQGLRTVWEYNTDLFDAATINRMTGHFQTLLEQIVAHPQQHINELPLLGATERQQLLVEWNNTQADYPQHCVHELFEVQASKTPDAVALVFEDEQLTYQQLNHRANQLAHYLRTLGVGPDVLVGICMERSLEMVVGLLGILKAGGAYVPIDPEYPQERLAYMLADSQVPVLLTQEKLVAGLPNHQARVICLDAEWEKISGEQTINPNSGVQPENLVYVIYTSGSTGKPKGAMNIHLGVCNRLLWMQEAYQLTSGDRVLQKTPFSFDVSVWEFFWTLITGARLVMAKPGGHRDGNYLVNLVVKEQITTLHFVPSMLQVFLESEGLEQCNSLHRVICSGEALPVDLQVKFFERLGCELHNLYGPTEAAIDVTFWQCQRQSQLRTVPIGRPIANTQIYLLDESLQPVPIGVAGELHIGGMGLARGYLNRSELTAEKFISNPFDKAQTSRLYKTGDLARYLVDGSIEYLGRLDNQVKIRGLRIELGEIEATLGTYPALRQTLVMVRDDVPGDKGLVAYLVAHLQQVPPSPSELRGFLQDKLPDYMVPAAFVMLDAMPLNPNGKVDRRALPAPDASHFSASNNFVAPRTPNEEVLAAIWAQVLGFEQVGIYNNFFELGGHSLLATQVISRIREAFGIDIQLQLLFQTPMIADLAEAIVQIQAENTEDDEINRFLTELEDLSDEEAQSLLGEVMQQTHSLKA